MCKSDFSNLDLKVKKTLCNKVLNYAMRSL